MLNRRDVTGIPRFTFQDDFLFLNYISSDSSCKYLLLDLICEELITTSNTAINNFHLSINLYVCTHTSHYCHQYRAPNFVISAFQGPSAELPWLTSQQCTTLDYISWFPLMQEPCGKSVRNTLCLIHKSAKAFPKAHVQSYSQKLFQRKLESALCKD